MNYLRRLIAFRAEALERNQRAARLHRMGVVASLAVWTVLFAVAHRADAQAVPENPAEAVPIEIIQLPDLPAAVPSSGATSGIVDVPDVDVPQTPSPEEPASLSVDLGDQGEGASNSVLIIIGITLLSLAPSLIIMMTSFTRMVIVLSLTRNALGLQAIPPNQVVTGLALFLSLFVMGPTLSKMNDVGLQPLLRGDKSQTEAFTDATEPLKEFMLANTRRAELNMMISASGQERPETPAKVSLTTLIPAFILSELKTAFIIGFAIFVPFLVVDLVVSAILMALGMMMLPPSFIALPFKLLLFVMVDGWSLVAESLLRSFR